MNMKIPPTGGPKHNSEKPQQESFSHIAKVTAKLFREAVKELKKPNLKKREYSSHAPKTLASHVSRTAKLLRDTLKTK